MHHETFNLRFAKKQIWIIDLKILDPKEKEMLS